VSNIGCVSSKGSPPRATSEKSSSEEEEEESDGGRPPREVESPTPVTKGCRGSSGADATEGAEAPAAGRSLEQVPSRATGVPASAAGALVSAAATTKGAAAAPAEPSRKRKWGFSSLR
jgi:hypothetical protein